MARSTIMMPHILLQVLKFGSVGLAATLTHVGLFVLAVETLGLAPLAANVAAFSVAVLVSFAGHFHWTFRPPPDEDRREWTGALARFIAVALFGLTLNSLLVYVTVNMLHLPYLVAAALMASVVPVFLFLLSRFWAFA